jgi:uncharacterized protein YprB with RNaseH-like and TPR domain
LIITKEILNLNFSYPLEQHFPLDKLLFFDIETTGFSYKTSQLYLIGCIFFQKGCWTLKQWFSESKEDEKELLLSFYDFSREYSIWVHFNGDSFDFPYLTGKYRQHHLDIPYQNITSLDLYKKISPYKKLLKLDSLKQADLEKYLQIHRKDPFHGGELISLYKEYIHRPDDALQKVLLLHNHEDLLGLTSLTSILSYYDFFHGTFTLNNIRLEEAIDYQQQMQYDLIIDLNCAAPIPILFSFERDRIYISGKKYSIKLKIRLYTGTLKYFYSNYKDYYYLPKEDTALHKSVASYVDKEYRIQAKAHTCYGKRSGCFLPQYHAFHAPAFQVEYKESVTFFEYQEDAFQNIDFLKSYILHLLSYIVNPKRRS